MAIVELIGYTTGTSNVAGILAGLIGSTIEVSGVAGSIKIIQPLTGIVNAATTIADITIYLPYLFGQVNATSQVADCLLPFRTLGFYESLSNQLAAYFQTNIADKLSIQVRYDNDPRVKPKDSIWMEYSIDYGSANQFEIGIKSYRHIGNINARLKVRVGVGTGKLLDVVDRVATTFKVIDINDIIFKVPRVVNVGRVEDEYQMNVICPFFVDE